MRRGNQKITKTAVDSLVPAAADYVVYDTQVPGFGLRVTKGGVRSYVLQYSFRQRRRRVTIGRHGIGWTADSARQEAIRMKFDASRGVDPLAGKKKSLAMPTLAEFADHYIREYAKPYTKTAKEIERMIRRDVLPTLGQHRLDEVTRADCEKLHASRAGSPTSANRCLALIGRLYSLAEDWGVLSNYPSPTRRIKRFPERRLERYLSLEEIGTLGGAIEETEKAGGLTLSACQVIRLLALTGMRSGEALSLRWSAVDLDRGLLSLTDSKTGPKVVLIAEAAVDLLRSIPRGATGWVFEGAHHGKHLVTIDAVWSAIRKRAGLQGVRLHDLRHTWASQATEAGVPLRHVGGALGHAREATTQRYAHLGRTPVRIAVDQTTATIAKALGSEPNGQPRSD